jgi:hypothetical protein
MTDRPKPPTATDRRWQEEFVLTLRLDDVTGPAIGQALAEVEAHCLDSGESAAEAFGNPREYADRLALRDASTAPFHLTPGLIVNALALVAGLTLVVPAAGAALRGDGELTLSVGFAASVALTGAIVLGVTVGLRFLLQRPVVATFVLGIAIAAAAVVATVLTRPLFSLAAWPTAVVSGVATAGLLAWSWWIRRRDDDPITDPVTGRAEPTPGLLRALGSPRFFVAVLAVLIWISTLTG